jgi:hypothetical protein
MNVFIIRGIISTSTRPPQNPEAFGRLKSSDNSDVELPSEECELNVNERQNLITLDDQETAKDRWKMSKTGTNNFCGQ